MTNFDVFIGHLAYELGKVNSKEIFSESKVYERQYGEVYRTEVISTHYNEVGVVFSIEEVEEDFALDYFEKQQAEIYGSIDLDAFQKHYQELSAKKVDVVTPLREALSVIKSFKKDIEHFEKIYDPQELTSSEQTKTENEFHELRQVKQHIEFMERMLSQSF